MPDIILRHSTQLRLYSHGSCIEWDDSSSAMPFLPMIKTVHYNRSISISIFSWWSWESSVFSWWSLFNLLFKTKWGKPCGLYLSMMPLNWSRVNVNRLTLGSALASADSVLMVCITTRSSADDWHQGSKPLSQPFWRVRSFQAASLNFVVSLKLSLQRWSFRLRDAYCMPSWLWSCLSSRCLGKNVKRYGHEQNLKVDLIGLVF